MDEAITLNEEVDLAKLFKHHCQLFKVNFEKAYNSVSWFFLDYMLSRFEFDDCQIYVCVFWGSPSPLVNGGNYVFPGSIKK